MSIHYVPGSVLARADVKTKARGAGDFPGSPVVKNLIFYCRGHGSIPSRELRSHMPCCMAKKKKKNPKQKPRRAQRRLWKVFTKPNILKPLLVTLDGPRDSHRGKTGCQC